MKRESPIIVKHVSRAVVCVFAFVALALVSGCNPGTSVRVIQNDVPVAGAEVFANNLRIGVTDSSGVLAFPQGLASGTTLVARKLVPGSEIPGYRQNHGPENGGLSWIERVYVTSMSVEVDGLHPLEVTNPADQQTLVLRSDNTLIGLHFLVSVVWDASDAELQDVGEKFRQAGEYIYNATDGQIYFEQIDIVDDSTFWRDADYHYHADINVHPNTWSLRGLFVPNVFGSAVSVSRNTSFQTIAHEFGHFGFGLMDEYMPAGAFCTQHVRRNPNPSFISPPPEPTFGPGMPKASCVMYRQLVTSKFCSNHFNNPHSSNSLEAANCWSVIASGFSDTLTPARWTIKTPETRAEVVVPLPANASARWQPRINIDNRAGPGTTSLCQPFDVMAAWPDGTPAPNWAVTLEVRGRTIEQGLTNSAGMTRVVGAHPGDRLWVGFCCGPWRTVIATPDRGPNTCGA